MLRNSVLRAEGIWKGYRQKDHIYWVLQGVDLEILEGQSVAILGAPGSGKSTLLKVLGFQVKPDQGQVYFQDRLLRWNNVDAILQMQIERVWLLNNYYEKSRLDMENSKRLRAVLLDEPEILICSKGKCVLSEQMHSLYSQGIAVIVATCEPEVATRAGVIYKLKNGKLEKITGKNKKYIKYN